MAKEIITIRDAETGELLFSALRRGEFGLDFLIGAALAMMYTDGTKSIVMAAEQNSFETGPEPEYHGKEDVDISIDRFMEIHRSIKATQSLRELLAEKERENPF